jgi:hypothetical protein
MIIHFFSLSFISSLDLVKCATWRYKCSGDNRRAGKSLISMYQRALDVCLLQAPFPSHVMLFFKSLYFHKQNDAFHNQKADKQ